MGEPQPEDRAPAPEGEAPPEVRVLGAEFLLSLPKYKPDKVEDLPQVCFAGRSNVGKSSLLNMLVNRKNLARASNTPGRTQLLNFFKVRMRRGEEERYVCFVDLPGYGYAKAPIAVREAWKPMVVSYVERNARLNAAVALLDIRHKPSPLDLELLEMLSDNEVPTLPVVTKVDKVSKSQRGKHLRQVAEELEVEARDLWPVSSETREGKAALLDAIWEATTPLALDEEGNFLEAP